MDWLLFAVQWLHVLLGITWFGYAISMYFLVGPAIMQMPEEQQRNLFSKLGAAGRVFPVVGTSVLVLGFIRGTFLGQSMASMTSSAPHTASPGLSRCSRRSRSS